LKIVSIRAGAWWRKAVSVSAKMKGGLKLDMELLELMPWKITSAMTVMLTSNACPRQEALGVQIAGWMRLVKRNY